MRDNVDLCKKRLGGGTIVMGNSLYPNQKLNGQTDEEYDMVNSMLSGSPSIEQFFAS